MQRDLLDVPLATDTANYWLRPFSVEDVHAIQAQENQKKEFEALTEFGEEGWRQVQAQGKAFTAFCGSRMLGFAGFVEFWRSRWQAWAILASTVNRYDMVWIHKTVKREIDSMPLRVRRLEITVTARFESGHRWAKMLGFSPEGLMKRYDQAGQDHVLFAITKD